MSVLFRGGRRDTGVVVVVVVVVDAAGEGVEEFPCSKEPDRWSCRIKAHGKQRSSVGYSLLDGAVAKNSFVCI